MKKLVVALTTLSVIFTVSATINVSAEEHQVQEQESLWGIAQKYGTSVQHLIDVNKLDSTIIHPGQNISIGDQPIQEKTATSYTVKKGDTLSAIGKANNVTVKELMDWNNLPNTIILIGQELKINHTSNENSNPETETEQNNKVKAAEEVSHEDEQKPAGKTISVKATAYTAKCEGCSGITSTGIDLNANPNKKVIAVDPSVIPLGTEVYVEGYGNAIAGDVGGAIKGNRIDIHVPSKEEATNWGVRTVDVTILN